MNEPRIAFETTADAASFPGTLATVNSVLHFHRGASVYVTCEGAGLADAHWRLLASCDRVVAAVGPGGEERHGECDIVVRIAPGTMLCAPIDDLVDRCIRSGACLTDSNDDPRLQVRRAGRQDTSTELLDPRVWRPCESHWDSIVDFRDRRFLNLSASSQPQRLFQSDDAHPFWSRSHRDLVLGDHPLQTYPYLWFLAMLWFGRCRDWSIDPNAYTPDGSRHLLDDLINCLPQIIQMLPPTRYQWNGVTHAMIGRAIDGIPRMLPAGGGMDDVLALVDAHLWIRRYVEVGSYEGGSVLTLALRFLARDIDFYAVESFMGNLDGFVDGGPLPSRQRFVNHLARFPALRARLVPGDSAHAAALFDDASLDCIFIDACHATEAVLRDIDAWLPKLARPGILAGDDYSFDSVFAAVGQRFTNVNIARSGTIWWVLFP